MKIIEKIVNIETGEEIFQERELTREELADIKLRSEKRDAEKAVQEKLDADKKSILEKLGITSEEAAILLS